MKKLILTLLLIPSLAFAQPPLLSLHELSNVKTTMEQSDGEGIVWNDTTKLWEDGAVGGGISGPVSSTDDALVLWDGTLGDTIKDSTITIPEAGSINLPGSLYINGELLFQYDQSGHNISLGENIPDPRTLSGTNNLLIGQNTGRSIDGTGGGNIGIGTGAIAKLEDGSDNIGIGYNAVVDGWCTDGNYDADGNIGIGNEALGALCTGDHYNIGIGHDVLYYLGMQSGSLSNIGIGYRAGGYTAELSDGDNNIFLGNMSGANVEDGSNDNIIIGSNAGPSTASTVISNKLYIDNTATDTPLIYGEFDNDLLRINGSLGLGDTGSRPTCDATMKGQMWYDAGGAGVADTFEVCLKNTGDTYQWETMATATP